MQILRVCLNYSMRREIVKLLSGAVSTAGVLVVEWSGKPSHCAKFLAYMKAPPVRRPDVYRFSKVALFQLTRARSVHNEKNVYLPRI